MYIYSITNLLDGRVYIGISKKKSCDSVNYMGSGNLIKEAIKTLGKENFKKEILFECECTYSELQLMEVAYIAKYNTTDRLVGYNISIGGDGNEGKTNGMYGKGHTKEAIAKMNKAKDVARKEDPSYGKWSEAAKLKASERWKIRQFIKPLLPNGHSEASKKKISEAIKRQYAEGRTPNRRVFSDEQRLRNSQMQKGELGNFYGKKHTPDTRQRMLDKARAGSPGVIQYDLSMNIIKVYEKIQDARDNGFSMRMIRRVDEGKRKSHKGFLWKLFMDAEQLRYGGNMGKIGTVIHNIK